MKNFEWNEISCEITEWTAEMSEDEAESNMDWGDGWPLKAKHEWFDEYRSDRNHLSLICEAETEEEAHALFSNSEGYSICMTDEPEED